MSRPAFPVLPLLAPRPHALPQPHPSTVLSTSTAHWTSTTHLFPAAFPRSRHSSVRPSGRPLVITQNHPGAPAVTKDEWRARVEEIAARTGAEEVLNLSSEEGSKELEVQPLLWGVAKCYKPTPTGRGRKVTLVLTHGAGMHKETWDPMLVRLLEETRVRGEVEVEEVWSLDAVGHGDAALINLDVLGDSYDWVDNGRDLANFVLHHLPTPEPSAPLPLHLPFLPSDLGLNLSPTPPAHFLPPAPHRSRTIIGLGHSLGGTALTLTASLLPTIFHSIILFDPILKAPRDPAWNFTDPTRRVVVGAMSKRSEWGSRDEAFKSLKANTGFFGRWDDEVLAAYVDEAMYATEDGKWRLKMPPLVEATVFLDPFRRGSQFLSHRLRNLSPNTRQHIYWAGVVPRIPPEFQPDVMALSGQCVVNTSETVEGAMHMVTQERPRRVGERVAKKLGELLGYDRVARL